MTDNVGAKTRDINAVRRVQQALPLVAQHLSWDEIAAQCGYASRGAAHNAVMRELDRCVVKNVEELRTQELFMLNQLHRKIWETYIDKKGKGWLFAADRILAISERRARLMGLDLKPDEQAQTQIIIQEIPSQYLTGPTVEGQIE